MIQRYLDTPVAELLRQKIVLIGGPRQVGKTTFAKSINLNRKKMDSQYLNWDYYPDRAVVRNYAFSAKQHILIFDELHKFRSWKSYIKGLYDRFGSRYAIIVTGSSRLNMYRKSGDSLFGRARYYTLHPFSVAELVVNRKNIHLHEPDFEKEPVGTYKKKTISVIERFLTYGGFPEPYIKQDTVFLRLWQQDRIQRVIREDIRDLVVVQDMSLIESLIDLIPSKVGSLFSAANIAQDLDVNYMTLQRYLMILEDFYFTYKVLPYTKKQSGLLRKLPKIYLWDWSVIPDLSARFENMIGSHLYKYVSFLREMYGLNSEVRFVRTVRGDELDFVVIINNKPWFGVEVKENDTSVSKSSLSIQHKLRIPYMYQVVKNPDVDMYYKGVRVLSAQYFLEGLGV